MSPAVDPPGEGSTSADAAPVVFRPHRLRIIAPIFAAALVLLYVVGWFALPAEYTAAVNLGQVLTLLAILVFLAGVPLALAACWVRADADGLTLRNGLRTATVPWSRVHQILLRPGDPWAWVLLKPLDGTRLADGDPGLLDLEKRQLMGIQTHDGPRAQRAVTELKTRYAGWLAATRSRGT